MKSIRCDIPNSLYEALEQRTATDGVSRDHLVADALAKYLGQPLHTLFQVSTSAALVERLYEGVVQVSRLLRHGDFGLGPSLTSLVRWSCSTVFVTRLTREEP